ncbi:MAG: OmpA family protein [Myxococcales bacterium]|nr:OmpA family protein [Myxococcales bacterium]
MPRTRLTVALLACLTAGAGCVTQGAYDRAVGERDAEISRLERELTSTSRSVDALGNERASLLTDMEALRDEIDRLEREKLDLSGEVREREQKLGEMRNTYDALVTDLESEVATGQLQISRMREGLTVQLPQEVLFGAGSATLSAEGRKMVGSLASRIRDGSGRIEVQGHSDDRPLSGRGRFATNWELAGARAAAVTVVLQANGVAATRLVASSYGEFKPVASNDTPAGRAQNRRIEVRVYEPAPPPGAAPTRSDADAPPPSGEGPAADRPPDEGVAADRPPEETAP